MAEKTAAERVALARHPQRPNITDYIDGLFTDFFEQRGDRACREDPAILGGIALFHGRPVTVIGTRKGKTLEENLKFIADALGTKGATPREAIRNYLLNGFYADHCKIYQKRPIYWLFSSGKKNAFKALVYMHRWEKTTVATVRTDYVHELQERYRTQLSMLGDQMEHAAQSERVKLKKRQEKLTAQLDEINAYEEKVHHLADRMMDIDLDDGVKVNYAKFAEILEKIK